MASPNVDSSVYLDRLARVRAAMAERDIDTLLLSVGHDLPYLTGYTAMPLERLTMLVVPRDGDATMVIPALEAPRVVEQPGVFDMLPWGETRGSRRRSSPGCPPGRSESPSATRCGHDSSSNCSRSSPVPPSRGPSTWSGRCGWPRTRPRSMRSLRRPTPSTGSPANCSAARSPSSDAPRPQVSAAPGSPHHRRGPRQGQLRDRRCRRECGESTPSRRVDRVIRQRRDRAVRLRRHDGGLLLGHHTMRVHRRVDRRGRRGLRGAARGAGGRRATPARSAHRARRSTGRRAR